MDERDVRRLAPVHHERASHLLAKALAPLLERLRAMQAKAQETTCADLDWWNAFVRERRLAWDRYVRDNFTCLQRMFGRHGGVRLASITDSDPANLEGAALLGDEIAVLVPDASGESRVVGTGVKLSGKLAKQLHERREKSAEREALRSETADLRQQIATAREQFWEAASEVIVDEVTKGLAERLAPLLERCGETETYDREASE